MKIQLLYLKYKNVIMLPGIYTLANKRGREREDIRQRQRVWREEREKLLGRERKRD